MSQAAERAAAASFPVEAAKQAVAQSASPNSNETLERVAKHNEKILDKPARIADAIAIAEMRQCQSSAQGAQAARMTACFFKAESASWSSSAQQAALEIVYNGGSLKSIEYGLIFNEKGKMRIELAAALFYKTHCDNDRHVYDIFDNHGEPPETLFWLMPSFKAKMPELAKNDDI
eukprot:6705913-Pyramimonas_sp.AAC.1